VVFAAAGLSFYKATEDYPFSAAGHAHPLLGGAHLAVQAAAVVGSAAVLLGALPLITAAVGRARSEPTMRLLVIKAVSPLVLYAAATALLVALVTPAAHASTASRGLGVAWALIGLGCGLACVVGSRAALFALPIAPVWLRWALAWGTVVTLAMVAVGIATAIYTVGLVSDASRLAASPTGPFQVVSTGAALILATVAMAAMCALAVVSTRRGWRGPTSEVGT
jgi:hypothetical protein